MKKEVTENDVRNFLAELQIMPKNKGFYYIEEALMIYTHCDEPWNLSVMNDVYPAIADKFHTTTSKAERNIRYTVGRIDLLDPPEKYTSLFGTRKDKYPSNSEFFMTVSYVLTR